MGFTERQRFGVGLLVAAGLMVGGVWYGLDFYKDAAGCSDEYQKQYAAVSQVRSNLATELNDSSGAFLNGIGDAILAPENMRAQQREKLAPLAVDFRATKARVAAGRAANPFPERPAGCDV